MWPELAPDHPVAEVFTFPGRHRDQGFVVDEQDTALRLIFVRYGAPTFGFGATVATGSTMSTGSFPDGARQLQRAAKLHAQAQCTIDNPTGTFPDLACRKNVSIARFSISGGITAPGIGTRSLRYRPDQHAVLLT
jgi:hypothetical protein